MKLAALLLLALAIPAQSVIQESVTVQACWADQHGNRKCNPPRVVVAGQPQVQNCKPDPVTKGCFTLIHDPPARRHKPASKGVRYFFADLRKMARKLL